MSLLEQKRPSVVENLRRKEPTSSFLFRFRPLPSRSCRLRPFFVRSHFPPPPCETHFSPFRNGSPCRCRRGVRALVTGRRGERKYKPRERDKAGANALLLESKATRCCCCCCCCSVDFERALLLFHQSRSHPPLYPHTQYQLQVDVYMLAAKLSCLEESNYELQVGERRKRAKTPNACSS